MNEGKIAKSHSESHLLEKFPGYNDGSIARRYSRRRDNPSLTSSVKCSKAIPVIASRKFYKATRVLFPLVLRSWLYNSWSVENSTGKVVLQRGNCGLCVRTHRPPSNVFSCIPMYIRLRARMCVCVWVWRNRREKEKREKVGNSSRNEGETERKRERDERWLSFHRAREQGIVRQPTDNRSKG